jgi:hypothetical protein
VWDPGRRDENKQDSSSPNPTQVISFLTFFLPLNEKVSLLGISIGTLPGPSEHIPGLSARFSTMSSRYFSNLSFYFSDFEQEGD